MKGLPLAQMIIIDGELSQTQPSMQHQQGQIQEFLMGGRVVVLLPNYSPGPSRPTLYHQKNLNLPQNRGGGACQSFVIITIFLVTLVLATWKVKDPKSFAVNIVVSENDME